MKSLWNDSDAHLLVVDDQVENLAQLNELLDPHYHVHLARDAATALHYLDLGKPVDLILLDVMMPLLGGYELCTELRKRSELADVPIVFLTALSTAEDEEYGLSLGANDFVSKPFSPAVVLSRIRNHVRLGRASRLLRQQNQLLEQRVAERTRELTEKNEELRRRNSEISAIQDATIMAFCSLAETRDNETGNHIKRTQHYVRALARHLQDHPRFAHELNDDSIELLYKSAPLHDIGKVGIPDQILLKPGKLTADEFEVMKAHTTLGRDVILQAERSLGGSVSFLRYAREIACYHQEWWDGSGYPEGLSGEAIPISARLMAVADVYDALISRRVYKPPFPHEEAVKMMKSERGVHFDPDVFDAFLVLERVFQDIAHRYGDNH